MTHWIQVGGWTLIHFAWQGTVLTLATAGMLRLCRSQSANTRYTIGCVALAAMLVAPVITACVLWSPVSGSATGVTSFWTISEAQIASVAGDGGVGDRIRSISAVASRVDALLPLVVSGWLAGVIVLLIRMAGGLWRVRRLQASALALAPSRWQAAGERVAARLGLPRVVRIVDSALVETPTVIGWLKPVILLPIAALANLTPSQVEAILAHELIHIRRHDYILNVVQTLAETLLFYHPGVWWLSSQVRNEREHCCDDAAVATCGDPVDYVTALAELEAYRSRGTTLALAATGGPLTARVRRLLLLPIGTEPRPVSWIVTVAVTLLLAGVGSVFVPLGQNTSASVVMAGAVQDVEPIASPDTFAWRVYPTPRFDVYYYPALEADLKQIADAAERAHQTISATLDYELTLRVPLVLFKTRSDFEQQTIIPDIPLASMRHVTSFSEPRRNRVVILIDENPDRWYRQVTHELTHIFAFAIIPRSRNNARVPTWLDEGLGGYMEGEWDRNDLAQLRDIVGADGVPTISSLDDNWRPGARLPYSLGHAFFDFIEAEYGVGRIRQFLQELGRSIVDGTGHPYQAAFQMTPDEFDLAFEQYMEERFR